MFLGATAAAAEDLKLFLAETFPELAFLVLFRLHAFPPEPDFYYDVCFALYRIATIPPKQKKLHCFGQSSKTCAIGHGTPGGLVWNGLTAAANPPPQSLKLFLAYSRWLRPDA